MTNDEIDALTIAEVRAINERAGEALKTLQALGLAPMTTPAGARFQLNAGAAGAVGLASGSVSLGLNSPAPYPCAVCGRAEPISPQEQAALGTTPPECNACGNPMAPVGPRTNKGHPTITAAQRAAKLAQPAFDANGEPT